MYPPNHPLHGMTQAKWDAMRESERNLIRDLSGLTSILIGFEGKRVEATTYDGKVSRFWVGRSTGWRPCHIEIKTRRSRGGQPVFDSYAAVRVIDHGPR